MGKRRNGSFHSFASSAASQRTQCCAASKKPARAGKLVCFDGKQADTLFEKFLRPHMRPKQSPRFDAIISLLLERLVGV
jgi:hypothetical protein